MLFKRNRLRAPVIAAVILTTAVPANAALTTFYGFDAAVGPGGAHPNADAARSAFLSAISPGIVGVENFEGDLIGGFLGGSRTLAFPGTGVTGTLTPTANITAKITDTPEPGLFPISGPNFFIVTTTGNTNFFDIEFSSGIRAFGFYGVSFSDYQGVPAGSVPPIRISLDGGAPIDVLNVDPATIPANSVEFFGVITDTPFTTLRMINPPGTVADGVAIDNFMVGQFAAAAPEPSGFALVGIGALSLMGYGWQKRRRGRV